jgi:hypothetical protein
MRVWSSCHCFSAASFPSQLPVAVGVPAPLGVVDAKLGCCTKGPYSVGVGAERDVVGVVSAFCGAFFIAVIVGVSVICGARIIYAIGIDFVTAVGTMAMHLCTDVPYIRSSSFA